MTDRVHYHEANSVFGGAEFEKDGYVAEIEHVGTADDDPDDGEPRYTFDVRIQATANTDEPDGDRDD